MSTPEVQANGTTEIDAQEFAAFQAFQAKKAADAAKAEAAKLARKRANNRPVDAAGDEMPAGQAYVKIQADYVEQLLNVFQNDPSGFMSRIRDDMLPTMRQVAAAPRLVQAATYDQQRKVLVSHTPPEGTRPVDAPKTSK